MGRSASRGAGSTARPRSAGRPATRPICRSRGCSTRASCLASAAHARIVSIDATAALALEGVVAVLTAADLPIAEGATGRAADALAREEVVWAGQPVALVVAETEPAALDASELVIVELDPLPAVLDVDAAMAPGAPLARVLGEEPSANVDGHAPTRASGDAAAAPRRRATPSSRATIAHRLDPPGLPRAAGGDGVDRARGRRSS